MNKIRYNHLNSYLKNKFGSRTLKICVDGGFSCPNRDGKVGLGGCIFCGEMGAGELIKGRKNCVLDSIENQVKTFLNSYRGERADKFIVYFQNFTNTYDTIINLKQKYDKALQVSDKIVGLQIATRPDTLSDEVIDLIASYKDKYYVCVELGLQTSNDSIGKMINRGYDTSQFEDAVSRLKNKGIDVVAHLMIGLPNETKQDVFDTISLINNFNCDGIKFHSTFILSKTQLATLYEEGKYTPITLEYYVEMVCKCIAKLNKNIIVHRITGDPPKELIIEPKWTTRKKIVLNSINKYLSDFDIFQGQDL